VAIWNTADPSAVGTASPLNCPPTKNATVSAVEATFEPSKVTLAVTFVLKVKAAGLGDTQPGLWANEEDTENKNQTMLHIFVHRSAKSIQGIFCFGKKMATRYRPGFMRLSQANANRLTGQSSHNYAANFLLNDQTIRQKLV